MRNFVIFLFALICPLLTYAQSDTKAEVDNRLLEVYEPSYLEFLQESNPFLLQRWSFYLDNAFFIAKDPKKEGLTYPEVEIADPKDFNILKLEKEQSLKRDWQKRMMYKIAGTNKILVFYSGKEFNVKLNDFLGRKH